MTLTEFSQMPKGLTMAQYEKLLQEKNRLEKQVKLPERYSGNNFKRLKKEDFNNDYWLNFR